MSFQSPEDLFDLLAQPGVVSPGVDTGSSLLPTKASNMGVVQKSDFCYDADGRRDDVMDDTYAAIVFPESFTEDLERFLTVVEPIIVFDKQVSGFIFIANKDDINKYLEKYQTPDHIAEGDITKMSSRPVPAPAIQDISGIQEDIDRALNRGTLQDQINFMYFLVSGNFFGDRTYEHQSGFDKIVKRVMLKKLSQIEQLPKTVQKKAIRLLYEILIMYPAFWNNASDQYNRTLGRLKFSNPLSLPVSLDNGSRGNLFEVIQTKTVKPYRIMHTVYLNKINQETDFSDCIINGDFLCKEAKKAIVLPQCINGRLDLAKYRFEIKTKKDGVEQINVIPDGVRELSLMYTINSFADLNKLTLPKETIREIWVANSLINKALNNKEELDQVRIFAEKYPNVVICNEDDTRMLWFGVKSFETLNKCHYQLKMSEILLDDSFINHVLQDNDELSEFRKFTKDYPNITIWNSNRTLSLFEVLEQQKAESEKQNEIKVDTQPKKQSIQEKTKDWLTRDEIVEVLKKDERFNDIDGWDRLIKRVVKAYNPITEYKLYNAYSVLCVHVDNIESVADSLLQIIHEDKERMNKKTKQQASETKTEPTLIKQEQPKKVQQPTIIEIEKYIPQNVWKDICDTCNDSSQLIISVLAAINKINVDFTDQGRSCSVKYFDENGQRQIASDIRKKDGCAMVQNVGTKRKHIVWTFNPTDKIIVAVSFLETHAESTRIANTYKEVRKFAGKGQDINGVTVTRDLVEQRGYLKIVKMSITPGENERIEVKDGQITLYVDDTKKQTEQTTSVVEEITTDSQKDVSDLTPVVETKKIKKPKKSKEKTDNETTKVQSGCVKENVDTKNVDDAGLLKFISVGTSRKRPHIKGKSLVDVKAEQVKIDVLIKKLDEEITDLSVDLYQQKSNPQEQFKILKKIESLIKQKLHYVDGRDYR